MPGLIIGIETRGYPSERLPDADPETITVVLVQGEALDVAAYIGVSNNPEWVACHGDKLPLHEVGIYFPNFEHQIESHGLTYRR
ncbi:MAG: hypothetical protein JWO38_4895 [Gemmataceae bacterium]|nr:hypothetical protein [Gemmataceae bacterium]